MVRSRSNAHSVRVLTIVLLLASSLLALAKPEDVLTADITQGKVGKLSLNGVVPHKTRGSGCTTGGQKNCTVLLHSLLLCAWEIVMPSNFRQCPS